MARTWMTEYGLLNDGWESAFGADLRRHYEICDGSHWERIYQCICSPGVQAMAVLRFGQWGLQQPRWARWILDALYAVTNLYIHVFWGIDLSRYAQIGPGVHIAHFGGITVSPYAVLGRNCNLSQSVTIGTSGAADREGAPVIGDDVSIGPGARVFGKIQIGKNVRIGANAVVNLDIAENAVVAVEPGFRILNSRDNGGLPQVRPAQEILA
jgi:serine O-acetyltransferase